MSTWSCQHSLLQGQIWFFKTTLGFVLLKPFSFAGLEDLKK